MWSAVPHPDLCMVLVSVQYLYRVKHLFFVGIGVGVGGGWWGDNREGTIP